MASTLGVQQGTIKHKRRQRRPFPQNTRKATRKIRAIRSVENTLVIVSWTSSFHPVAAHSPPYTLLRSPEPRGSLSTWKTHNLPHSRACIRSPLFLPQHPPLGNPPRALFPPRYPLPSMPSGDHRLDAYQIPSLHDLIALATASPVTGALHSGRSTSALWTPALT